MGLTGQPPIPEEGPGWPHTLQQQQQAASAEACHARRMPTLLEQLQLYERQRHSSMPHYHAHASLAMARNTSFERCGRDAAPSLAGSLRGYQICSAWISGNPMLPLVGCKIAVL